MPVFRRGTPRVFDVSDSVLTQKMIDIETLSANTGNLYLRAGAYTIRVERGYSWSGKPYALAVNVSQAVNTEEESNDTIQTANDIPLNEDMDEYFEREVLPFSPEAWIDHSKDKIGYEIPFTRTFYEYEQLESADAIAARIEEHEHSLMRNLNILFGKGDA